MGYGPLSSYSVRDASGTLTSAQVTNKGLVLGNPKGAATPVASLPSVVKAAIPPVVKKGR